MKYLKELFLIIVLALGLIIWGIINATLQQHVNNPNPVPLKKLESVVVPDHTPTGDVFVPVKVPVFMYHHLGDLPTKPKPNSIRRDLTVSAANFDEQMKYLADNGYACISTEQLYQYSLGKLSLNKKPCVITFDDGYLDSFTVGVPILQKYDMVGSFAVITQYVGNPDYADWGVLSAAQKQGMEIIAHSQHHIDFISRQYDHATKVNEVQGSMDDIKKNLGTTPVTFVYPYGHYDNETRSIVMAAGFKLAFTTRFGLFDSMADPLLEPRIRVHGAETLVGFEKALDKALGVKYSPIDQSE